MKPASAKLRAAVIGVGYLGNFHAQKYAQSDDAELVAVVDTDAARCAEIAAKYATNAVSDYAEVLGDIDVVSIVVPPANHFSIARDCLDAGVHALVEKPVTERVDQAEALIELARERDLVLQVGHLERFNPLMGHLATVVTNPTRFEAQRFAPHKQRGTEVDVVLDLMIHDIDIVLSFTPVPVKWIQASGAAVMTEDIDIANARLEFANGVVAELAASRVSQSPTRLFKVFEGDRFTSVDTMNHVLNSGTVTAGVEAEDSHESAFERAPVDVLMAEIASFLAAVRSGSAPKVSGEDGKRALELAIDISRRINRYRATEKPIVPTP